MARSRVYRYDVAWPGVWYKAPPGWTVASWDDHIRPFGGIVVILKREEEDDI